jgi:uncharacterized protein
VIEVARRDGYDIVSPRHPEHPLRVNFAGVPAYEPSPDWVITGRYVPFAEPRPTTVGSIVGDLVHVYEAPGYADFAIGQRFRLTAFPGRVAGSLHILFTDATSGVTTYRANPTTTPSCPWNSWRSPPPTTGARLARAHEENGWDRMLFAYGSELSQLEAAA